MTVFIILFIAIIVGSIGLSIGFVIFKKLQNKSDAGKTSINPMLAAFIGMCCSILVICIILIIAYIIFIVWALKDFTLF